MGHARHRAQRIAVAGLEPVHDLRLIRALAQPVAATVELSHGQLKILQEVITLAVFVPFAWLYMREPVRMNYLWAALCMCGAVYFMFRK